MEFEECLHLCLGDELQALVLRVEAGLATTSVPAAESSCYPHMLLHPILVQWKNPFLCPSADGILALPGFKDSQRRRSWTVPMNLGTVPRIGASILRGCRDATNGQSCALSCGRRIVVPRMMVPTSKYRSFLFWY